MNVVPLGAVSNDIPAGLRQLAQQIEDGEFPDLKFVTTLTVANDAAFTCFAWGPCSILEVVGAHARAVAT